MRSFMLVGLFNMGLMIDDVIFFVGEEVSEYIDWEFGDWILLVWIFLVGDVVRG